ncbi:MAG: FAD-dependent oxidoreductase [Butyrivibrio sp.]|nr:FAD-dependent oxidoreductase [Acetatifactor muris]MCM1558381.1 FAD-dependent oxidoreductase [Butyrivibrio sp.]
MNKREEPEGMFAMESLWESTVHIAGRKPAEGLYERDVVVIGAGMTGILTAWHLQRAGKRVAVLEAGRIGSGQTGRTTAKITSQHGMIYSRLLREIGQKKARLYAEANQKAIAAYERIIKESGIDCDFVRLPAYLYSVLDRTGLCAEAAAASALGIAAYEAGIRELPFATAGAVCFENQAQFHPLKFIRALAAKLEIYENSPVRSVGSRIVCTDRARFLTKSIVFATHYPLRDVPGFYFLRQHQERSYVVALKGCEALHGMYYCVDAAGLSLRSAGDVLLLGGNAHRTGESRKGGAYGSLKAAACKFYPEARIVHMWAAQDCMPHDGIPLIGRYSLWHPNWYVATGYGKWGMTSSMVAALLLTDMITGKRNPWENLFAPGRIRTETGGEKFRTDVKVSVDGLWKGLTRSRERCRCGEGELQARCTHMGCKLVWNPHEKTWECPCHGSRFDGRGRLLDGPAQKPLSIRQKSINKSAKPYDK